MPKHVEIVICVIVVTARSEFFGRRIEFTVLLAGHDRAVGNNVWLRDGWMFRSLGR